MTLFICKHCLKEKKNKNSLINHERLCSKNANRQKTFFETNKEEVKTSKKNSEYNNQFTKADKLGLPKPVVSIETRKKISEKSKARKMSDDVKMKISKSMKIAHAENRAWNIGKSRWNNQPSWPEKWFMIVISNEFEDKKYIREHPFHRFSLDFVWLHKKKVIEIDGDQHDRFQEQKNRDIEKDKLLLKEGFSILRIRWKDICINTKDSILKMKYYIDN
jgi:very-short-patch-repair endonuclease